jgi:hypothetical protein
MIVSLDQIKAQSVQRDNCWIWSGRLDPDGYGRLKANGRVMVHQIIYELMHGPIPKGYELHHICRIPACVNPEHLELKTPAEHRMIHRLIHCQRGHEFTPENTVVRRNGDRQCRICVNARWRERWHRKQ